MGKSVNKRISDAFKGQHSSARAKEYGDRVYASWKDISSALGRDAILIFVLMAIFELWAYQRSASAISIGSFTLANAPIVQIALPAVISYIVYDGIRLIMRWIELQNAYFALVKIYAYSQWDNDLDVLVRPHLPSLWAVGHSTSSEIARTHEEFMRRVNMLVSAFFIFVVPVAFEVQAYYRLIQKFGYQNVLTWISATITTLLMSFTGIYVWLNWHD